MVTFRKPKPAPSTTSDQRQVKRATATGGSGNQVNLRRNGETVADTQSYPRVVPFARTGTATIVSGQTDITVTHGSLVTPVDNEIFVTPTNNPDNDPGYFFVDAITATTFDINVRNNPGASGASFSWRITDAPGSGDEVVIDQDGNTSTTATGRILR